MNYDRTLKIISKNDLEKINKATVLLVGIGGVGGYCAECLVRSGIENLIIYDGDVVDETNLNRQLVSLSSTITKSKVDVLESRLKDINSKLNITSNNKNLTCDNISELDNYKIDYIIDACDMVSAKVDIIKYAIEHNISVISCMGTGNRFNPQMLKISALNKSKNDPLAKVMRKLVKEANLPLNIPIVYSEELPIKLKDRTPGSMVFVPASAGILLAYYVIDRIIKTDN